MLTFSDCAGADLLPHLDALARLRVEVFRDWPYLYDGDLAYERRYLRAYADNPLAFAVLARDAAGEVVGMSTALPLAGEHPEFRAPFEAAGLDIAEVYYAGESVLLAPHRGHGAGREFFARREARGRSLGFRWMAFCAVVRDPADPRCPDGHVPLDAFWTRLGYVRRPALATSYRWKEVGSAEPTDQPMVFWTKPLA